MENNKMLLAAPFFGFVAGITLMSVIYLATADAVRDSIIESYKAGDIVCVELGSELVCRRKE